MARVAQEQLEQRVLGAGQLDLARAAAHPVRARVEREAGEPERRVLARRARAAQEGAHAREQLPERERLHEVVVGAEVEAADRVLLRVARGEHEDRRAVAARAQAAADLEAVEVRHQDVEDDRVELAVREPLQRVEPVGGRRDAVPVELERGLDRLADVGVVVDDEEPAGLHRRSVRAPA